MNEGSRARSRAQCNNVCAAVEMNVGVYGSCHNRVREKRGDAKQKGRKERKKAKGNVKGNAPHFTIMLWVHGEVPGVSRSTVSLACA